MPHANWRMLLVICLGTVGWALTFGIGSQITTLTLKAAGHDDFTIGVNTATYYVGIALGALLVPRLLRRWGCRSAALGMLVSGLALALFPCGSGLLGWFALRLIAGIAGAWSVVPLETFVSCTAPAGERSRRFAWFAVAITVGGAAGIGLGLPLYQDYAQLAFFLGAVPALLSGLGLTLTLPRSAVSEQDETTAPLNLRENLLSFGTAWSQGFLEGGMLAFLALYLLALGLSAEAAGGVMVATLLGVIVFQVPVGWLADHLGTTAVLLGCYLVTAAGLVMMPWCGAGWLLALWLFLIGACSGAFYPLGLALLGERLPPAALPRAYAAYLAAECIGSMMGPVCMGLARDVWGEAAMFGVGLIAVVLIPGLWLALRRPGQRS